MRITILFLALIIGCDSSRKDELSKKWKSATPEQRHEIYANNDIFISGYLIGKSHSVVNDFLGPPDGDNEKSTWTYDFGILFEAQVRYSLIIQYNDKGLVEKVDGYYLHNISELLRGTLMLK
jgi:hypothetical protein